MELEGRFDPTQLSRAATAIVATNARGEDVRASLSGEEGDFTIRLRAGEVYVLWFAGQDGRALAVLTMRTPSGTRTRHLPIGGNGRFDLGQVGDSDLSTVAQYAHGGGGHRDDDSNSDSDSDDHDSDSDSDSDRDSDSDSDSDGPGAGDAGTSDDAGMSDDAGAVDDATGGTAPDASVAPPSSCDPTAGAAPVESENNPFGVVGPTDVPSGPNLCTPDGG